MFNYKTATVVYKNADYVKLDDLGSIATSKLKAVNSVKELKNSIRTYKDKRFDLVNIILPKNLIVEEPGITKKVLHKIYFKVKPKNQNKITTMQFLFFGTRKIVRDSDTLGNEELSQIIRLLRKSSISYKKKENIITLYMNL